jgi:transglutaminase-like putative cysteine protease
MTGDLPRRRVLARGAALVASTVATPLLGARGWDAPVAEAATTTNQQTNANRAVAIYNAMQKYFYVQDGTSLYRETDPWTGGKKYAYLRPFSRALVGTLALAGVPTSLVGGTSYTSVVQDRFTGLTNY